MQVYEETQWGDMTFINEEGIEETELHYIWFEWPFRENNLWSENWICNAGSNVNRKEDSFKNQKLKGKCAEVGKSLPVWTVWEGSEVMSYTD